MLFYVALPSIALCLRYKLVKKEKIQKTEKSCISWCSVIRFSWILAGLCARTGLQAEKGGE